MHYTITGIIIILIAIWQIKSFLNNRGKIFVFKNVFPDNTSELTLSQTEQVFEIEHTHKNTILDSIVESLNNYLKSNSGRVSDFHLMKDIIDRNCDAKEQEINAQIPVPLYIGLAGTMLGILIGVGSLVFTGGLEDLLNPAGNGSGAQGIETLLGGVALAMISSIIGIMLTTFGTQMAKNATSFVEKNKNTFLSWIQAELLPKISSDISSALMSMTGNLLKFNETFAKNTVELGETLQQVNKLNLNQAEVIKAINKMKIQEIAAANINVYEKLKDSTNEIGIFAEYLTKSNDFYRNIQTLNSKLIEYETRTQVIESAGRFFAKNEIWLAENFDKANLEVGYALTRFKDDTTAVFNNIAESLNGQILNFDHIMQQQNQKLQGALVVSNEIVTQSLTDTYQNFEKAISDQQMALQSKLQGTSLLVQELNGVMQLQNQKLQEALLATTEIVTKSLTDTYQNFEKAISDQQMALQTKLQDTSILAELKNLTSIKDGIQDFKEATNNQNKKIEELTKEIRALTNSKREGGAISQEIRIPMWSKILIISGGSIISLACLMYILPSLINLVKNLIN